MKKILPLLLLFLISFTGSGQNKTLFVNGLSSGSVYSKDQAEKGVEFLYKDGRTFKIKVFFEVIDLIFYAFNENNQKSRLDASFEVGYSTPDGEWYEMKQGTNLLIGQYDFDSDDIDELIIALQDNDENDNGISINVFKLQNDTWNKLGILTGKLILGEPLAEIKMNKITIPRYLRGFYYQYTFESNKFTDTSDL